MNAPLSPTVPNKKKRKRRGSRGGGNARRARTARSFSTLAGTRRALSTLTCPHVDPSRELSDLTWSSSKRFSPSARGPLARLFSSPKMAETTIQHGRTRLFFLPPFFPSLSRLFSLFFLFLERKPGGRTLRIQWRLSISNESFVALAVGRSSSSIDARPSVSFERCRNIFV